MFCINDKNYLFEKYPLLQKIHEFLQSSPNYYVLNIEFSNYKKNIIIYIKYKGTIISFILNEEITIENIKRVDIIPINLYVKLYIYDILKIFKYYIQFTSLFEVYIENYLNSFFIKYFNYYYEIEHKENIKNMFSLYIIRRIFIDKNFNNITLHLN